MPATQESTNLIERRSLPESILPDIVSSFFFTKKHEYFGTFEEIPGKMKALIDNDPKESKEQFTGRGVWRKWMHYMAALFSSAFHNKNLPGICILSRINTRSILRTISKRYKTESGARSNGHSSKEFPGSQGTGGVWK